MRSGMWLGLSALVFPVYASLPSNQLDILRQLKSTIDLILNNEHLKAIMNPENPSTSVPKGDVEGLRKIMQNLNTTCAGMMEENGESMNIQEVLSGPYKAMGELQTHLAHNYEWVLSESVDDLRSQIEGALKQFEDLLTCL